MSLDQLTITKINERVEHQDMGEMVLNMGPQHPSTHGVINFVVHADGEVMKRAIPQVGYLHRAIEKIGEIVTYNGFMPYTDRVDYLAAMFANEGYAIAVEKLANLVVPPRAQYLRAISCELNRIASHLVSVGTMAMDIGAVTPFPYALRERESINDLIEALCGARLTYNYHRIGGVAFDMPDDWIPLCRKWLDHFDKVLDEWDRLISRNEIFIQRLAGLAVIPAEMAIDYGLVGPNLRASGVDFDLRRDHPYGAYPDFTFKVPVGKGYAGERSGGKVGDSYDRFYCRVLECRESVAIVRQAVDKLPAGEFMAKVPKKIRPEAWSEAQSRIEAARGEMAYYVVSDGGERPYRVRARTGSYLAMGIIEDLSRGLMIADLVALIASLDVVAPENGSVTKFLDEIIRGWGHDPATWPLTQGVYLGAMLLVGILLTTFGAVFAGMVSWWERRVAGRMQSRIGPNRVGPGGFLQWIADALKLILKEDLIPDESDHVLFRIAPYFVLVGFVLTFVVLPFGYQMSATNMNVGLFYVVSITALVVVGILISGWASNSKWSLFGGIRAAAQVVSYEIPAGLAILVPIMMAGSLNMHDIIRAQGGNPWNWFLFQTPMGFAAFFVLFTALLAEGNRTPFDLPEAESEIVAGYNTEYSGMRFGYFFLAEWGNLWVMSAILTTLFLGGWQVPFLDSRLRMWEAAGSVPGWFYAASAGVFILKVLVLVNVVIWIRWTFPRIRVDQMMSLCWKYLVPIAMALVVLTAVNELVSFNIWGAKASQPVGLSHPRGSIHFAWFAIFGLLPLAAFAVKTRRNIALTGDRVDLTNW